MSFTYYFYLPGVSCVACVEPLDKKFSGYTYKDKTGKLFYREKLLDKTSSSCTRVIIESHPVCFATKTKAISVEGHDDYQEEVEQYLQALMDDVGVESTYIGVKPTLNSNPADIEYTHDTKKNKTFMDVLSSHEFKGIVGLIFGFSLLMLSLFSGGLPLWVLITIGFVSTALTLWLGASSYYHAYIKLTKTRILTMDTLFAISTITVLVVSIAAFFVPWLSMMFETSILIFAFRHVGLSLEESIKQKMNLNKKCCDRLPRTVSVLNGEKFEERELAKIVPDDVLLIRPGEIIPVDGHCLSMDGLIYDTIRTGNPRARSLQSDEAVISGMQLAEDLPPIHLKASAIAKESYLPRLDADIERANREKAPIEEVASKILQYFIPTILGLSILSVALVSCFFPFAIALQCGIAVMVAACPCALGLIPSLGVTMGVQKAAEHGVKFKSGKALQAANAIDVVVLDLHGTLTTGVSTVTTIKSMHPDFNEESLLALAAALERTSKHAMAKAVCETAKQKKIMPVDLPWDAVFDNSNHCGVKVLSKEDVWAIGNQTFMHSMGVLQGSLPSNLALNPAESVIYLVKNKQLVGYLVVSDPLRKDARQTVDALKKLGKTVYICTGAEHHIAKSYAELLGIPEAHVAGGCVGKEEREDDRSKSAFLQDLRAQGFKPAMVGDALNDARGIAECDFGIAVQSDSGSEVTQQEAGAVIQEGSLLPVVSAFAIAKQTMTNIYQNLGFSFTYNALSVVIAGGLLLAVGMTLNPGIGVAIMILQTVLILANAWRLKRQPLEHLQSREEPISSESIHSESYQYLNKTMKPGIPAPAQEKQRSFNANMQSSSSPLFVKKTDLNLPSLDPATTLVC